MKKISRRGFVEHSAITAGLMGMAGLGTAQGAESSAPPSAGNFTAIDLRQFGAKGDGENR